MDRNPDSPWNPRLPAEIGPHAFERLVLDWLVEAAGAGNQEVEARHLGVVRGRGGEYKIDVLLSLAVLGGARMDLLVECKHQGRPVEREEALILEAKLRDVGAHKGIIFSTSGFQRGARDYARAHGIATDTVVRGE